MLAVFDLDGTLVDSLPDIAAAVNRLLARRSLPALTLEAVRPMVGDGLPPLMARVFASAGAEQDSEAAAEYLADYEANAAVETRLYAGMGEALGALCRAGWRLAVCTNKPERAARRVLSALGIDPLFAAVGGGDSFPARKPDPAHLRATIALAGGTGGAVMVGDHANDMAAARGAGLPAIFAAWGYGTRGMAAGADAIAETPSALPSLLSKLAQP